ncbi:arylsulfatase [Sphingomonas sp. C3-2]|uniref:arylsulfatase n=1 Tax=Sphingomonas sp. C3-2 TaxID=3062169 RepID=UPI00294B1E68|nr:arylsulfatase [Sphingomonas sp. C3-2]WOK37279.1 arylsulfatase [Sphingomonas sp. C3-2]
MRHSLGSRQWFVPTALIGLVCVGVPVQGSAAPGGEVILPRPLQPFAGKIGPTAAESVPAAAETVKAPAGAPNVLLVLTDDVGFGAASTFGGPIPTPNLDRLASGGLKYNRFHTTAMCSPTRAALLTGRNSHVVGTGAITDFAMGFPGYNGVIPKSAATVAETLRLNGYNTAMFGKHHNIQPGATSRAGPFDQWPTGLGFEYFYGFVGGQTNQFSPTLYRGTTPVHGAKDELLDKMLVDDALDWIHNQQAADADKPFFIYLAPGSAHAPHQAPADWIARFKGMFDQGWDQVRTETLAREKRMGVIPGNTGLTPRPAYIPAWASLTPARRQISARMMEVYAGMLAYQDAQFGRLIDELERMGEFGNTLVIFIEGDNGGSAEAGVDGDVNMIGTFFNGAKESEPELLARLDELGGPRSNENYPAGWAWAMGTPFQWTKTYASHLGGARNGLVISWPDHIKERGLRTQFHHVVDIAPTILEAAGLPQPDVVNGARQRRMDGVAMGYSFADARAAGQRHTQYFELIGNRGIYHDGWWAGTTPQNIGYNRKGTPIPDWPWELYNLDKDFSQSRDLARVYPQKLAEMKALFATEAERNNVFPVDDQVNKRAAAVMGAAKPKSRYVYWGKNISIPSDYAPRLSGSFTLTADIRTASGAQDGVLAALGGHFGGWSFYLKDGRPTVTMAGSTQADRVFRVAGRDRIPAGTAIVRYDFAADKGPGSGGQMRISVNDREVASGRIERALVMPAEVTDTFDVGLDSGTLVTGEYEGHAAFKGEIHRLEVVPRG